MKPGIHPKGYRPAEITRLPVTVVCGFVGAGKSTLLDEELWTSFVDPFGRPGWENRQAKWPRQEPPGRSH